MKNHTFYKYIFSGLICLSQFPVLAYPGGGPEDFDEPPIDPAPIDNGIVYLIIAALVLGIWRYHKYQKLNFHDKY
ncbi:MAG: hypothetical protein WCY25_00670 [Moheibacter sp.]